MLGKKLFELWRVAGYFPGSMPDSDSKLKLWSAASVHVNLGTVFGWAAKLLLLRLFARSSLPHAPGLLSLPEHRFKARQFG